MKIKFENLTNIKHEILLFSLLLLLFGQLFIPGEFRSIMRPLLFAQTIFAGIILFSDKKFWRNLLIILFVFVFCIDLLNYFYDLRFLPFISGLIYIFFFFSVSAETYRQIYKAKEVKPAMIAAVFSGFILLCLMAAMFFTLIEFQTPESFSNLGSGDDRFQDLSYFSFITTLTIGYGDITPLTMHAKKATMLVALLGNFYSVFVTGIVIGKYLSRKNELESNNE